MSEIDYDSSGKEFNGKKNRYHENGQVQYLEEYINGKLVDGTYEYFHKNGQLETKFTSKNGNPDGRVLMLFENGNISGDYIWENGMRIKMIEYLDNGNISRTGNHPFYSDYYYTGEIYRKYNIDNGEMIEYHISGPKVREWNVGKFSESYTVWDLQGNIILEKGNGIDIEYYEIDKIKSRVKVVNGNREGEYISYYENGQTMSVGNYTKGNPIGKHISYF